MKAILKEAIIYLLKSNTPINTETVYVKAFGKNSARLSTKYFNQVVEPSKEDIKQSQEARKIINELLCCEFKNEVYNHKIKLINLAAVRQKELDKKLLEAYKESIISFKLELSKLLEKYGAKIEFDFEGETSEIDNYGISILFDGFNVFKLKDEFSLGSSDLKEK